MGITTFEAATTPAKSGFNPSSLILILVVVVAFYLLMIRPQQRRRQQAAQKQNTIQPGARVRTTAGMYATVVEVDGDDVVLEIAPGIEVRYMKRAVMDVVSGPEDDEAPADETATDYYDPEHADDAEHAEDVADAHPADDVNDTVPPAASANGSAASANGSAPQANPEETAYEQATGTKKD